jgi:hypothetical protein
VSVTQSEVFEAFRAVDIPEDRALEAATARGKRDDELRAGVPYRDLRETVPAPSR